MPKYQEDKNYSVELSKAVEHEGFTLKPGLEPTTLRGDVVALLDSQNAVKSAELLPDEEPHPESPPETHIQSDF